MKLSDLAPAPYNPRDITAEALSGLKASLGDFGDLSGITWNSRTGHLVCGHQRLRALQEQHGDELRMVRGSIHTPTGEQFKVREVDWPEEKERAANITANSPLISGAFTGQLEDILASLEQDYSEMFAPLRLDEMLGELQPPAPLEDDEVPEPPKDPVTQAGDVWVLGGHRLACGDSTEAKVVAACLSGGEPFIMVTDPPYGVEYDAAWRGIWHADGRRTGNVMHDDRADWSGAYKHFGGAVAYTWSAPGDHVLVSGAAIQAVGFVIRYMLIWSKPHFPIGRGHYHWRHEPCWYAVRRGETAKWVGDRKQETVWDIALDENVPGGHSTQKPLECMARPIRNHGGSDDHVYDPFLGSGTTIIAAEQLNRRCFGIEISPAYCDVIVERWENLTGGKATR